MESTTRTDKEASTDCTADSNHLHVPSAKVTLEMTLRMGGAFFHIVRLRLNRFLGLETLRGRL